MANFRCDRSFAMLDEPVEAVPEAASGRDRRFHLAAGDLS
jgi:hypothetical protein